MDEFEKELENELKSKERKENSFLKFIKDSDKTNKLFSTVSSFAIGIAIYVLAQGLVNGFNISDIWHPVSLGVGIASGLGIPAVQNDGIRKAAYKFMQLPLFKRYREENIEYIDKIDDKEFRREYVNTINISDISDIREEEYKNKYNNLKDLINDLNALIQVSSDKKKTKHTNNRDVLQAKLDNLDKETMSIAHVKFEPLQVTDLFSIGSMSKLRGRQRVVDTTEKDHQKQNWIARFYMPMIMMFLQGSLGASFGESIWSVLGQTVAFMLVLAYSWYASYNKQYDMKVNEALPKEINKNGLLKQAHNEYIKKAD